MKARLSLLGRTLTFAAGLGACVAALMSTEFGLGEKTQFILYRMLHLSRTSTLCMGLFLILASLLPGPAALFRIIKAAHRYLRTAVIEADRKIKTPMEWRPFLIILVQQLTLALAVASLAFWFNRHNLLGYIDGQYLLTLNQAQKDFAGPGFIFYTNPLQGLGDLWTFANTSWLPEFFLTRSFVDPELEKIVIHIIAFSEIFVATSLFAYWLTNSSVKAMASGWLAVILITPLTFPALIYNIHVDNTQVTAMIVWPLAIVPILWGIGRASWLNDAMRTFVICIILWTHFIALNIFTALAYPFLAIVGIAFIVGSRSNGDEFWRKIGWTVVLILLLTTSGLPQALFGIVKDSAFQFFPQELMRPDRVLIDGSILFRASEPVGIIVAVLGFVGACYHFRYSRGRLQLFTTAVVLLAASIWFASLLYISVGWSGAIPIYYEIVLWTIYPIFCASLLISAFNLLSWHGLTMRDTIWEPIQKYAQFTAPLLLVLVLHGPNYLRHLNNERPNVFPPKATELTDFLRKEIGLVPGGPFRGRVVTMTGQWLPDAATWGQMFGQVDMKLIEASGNDHRSIGLWYYGIPTLFEFSHTIRPAFYSLARRYFANENDIQVSNILNMRRPDVRILQMTGVRYIISDNPTPIPGTHRVRELNIIDYNRALAIDEISMPNIGISPTQIKLIPSDGNALDMLGDTSIDLNRTVIMSEALPDVLTPANEIQLTIERGAINVRAKSPGTSLVVLPFEYSRCLQALSNADGQPLELKRVNFLLTGIVIHGDANVTIRYHLGPFQSPQCRIYDLNDDLALLRHL